VLAHGADEDDEPADFARAPGRTRRRHERDRKTRVILDRVWSLVNAPVLAFDAGRLPSGAAFAADLLGALQLDARSLMLLDVVADELPPIDTATDRATRDPETLLAALTALRADLAADPVGKGVRAGTAERIARAPLGHPAGIAGFVQRDVFDWTAFVDGRRRGRRWSRGAALVAEIVTASHVGDLGPHPRREAWERVRPVPHGPTGLPNDVDARLDELAGRLTPASLAALEARAPRGRLVEGESWAELVHAATQVLFLTDRLRSAAIAQLRAALLVRAAHPGPAPLDALSAIGGAVQAWAAQDLMDDVRYAALVTPVIEVLGVA
jgi:hypothetical protein